MNAHTLAAALPTAAERSRFLLSLPHILELQPEQVEKDVGDWWRALYKLGKALAGLDGPLRVVASGNGGRGARQQELLAPPRHRP